MKKYLMIFLLLVGISLKANTASIQWVPGKVIHIADGLLNAYIWTEEDEDYNANVSQSSAHVLEEGTPGEYSVGPYTITFVYNGDIPDEEDEDVDIAYETGVIYTLDYIEGTVYKAYNGSDITVSISDFTIITNPTGYADEITSLLTLDPETVKEPQEYTITASDE